jgi:hypothetical protein
MRKYLHLNLERRNLELLLLAVCVALADDEDDDEHSEDEYEEIEEDEEDEDLLICALVLAINEPNPRLTINNRHCARIDRLSVSYAISHFRFKPSHIRQLLVLLQLPELISCGKPRHTHQFRDEEGVLLLLRRLAYPCRWVELVDEFGLHVEELSELFAWMIKRVNNLYGHLLNNLNMWQPQIPYFAKLISDKGAPNALHIFGFLDGTLRGICRPKRGQRAQYSGHKRRHGLKYQSVCLPNGIIAHLHGPEDGRRHDRTLFRNSGVLGQLQALQAATQAHHGTAYTIYGDSAYHNDNFVVTGFKGDMTDAQRQG